MSEIRPEVGVSKEEPTFSTFKLIVYALAISGGSFQFGYAMGIYSPISKVWMTLFEQHDFHWSIVHDQPENTLVNTVMYIGAFAGALTASIYAKKRRLYGNYFFHTFCFVGALLTNFINYPCLFIGRLIHGYGAGCFSYLIPLMCKQARKLNPVNQISPPKWRGAIGVLFQITVTLGILIAALIGFGLPKRVEDVDQDNFIWRLLSGFPMVVSILVIFMFMTCYRFDTPQRYLDMGDRDSALRALQLVYTSQGAGARLHQLEAENIPAKASTTSSENLSGNSTKALWVCLIFSTLQQLTGINGIIFYSSQIFGNSDKYDIYDGIVVSVLVGGVNFGSTLLSLAFVEKMGRKLILIIGFILMAIFDVMTGVFQQEGMETPEKVAILLFIAAFEFSAGPLLWAYMPEVLNGSGVMLGAVTNWLFVIIISVVTPQLAKLDQWMFYIFAICNAIGAVFISFFLVQSKGRSKAEMIDLYNGRTPRRDTYSVMADENEVKKPLRESDF